MIAITEENALALSSVFRRQMTEGSTMVTQRGLRAVLTVHTVHHRTYTDLRVEYVEDRNRFAIEVHDVKALAVTSQGLLVQSPCMDVTMEIECPCGQGGPEPPDAPRRGPSDGQGCYKRARYKRCWFRWLRR